MARPGRTPRSAPGAVAQLPGGVGYSEMPLADQRNQQRMRRPLPVVVRSRGQSAAASSDSIPATSCTPLPGDFRPSADAYGPLAAPVVDGQRRDAKCRGSASQKRSAASSEPHRAIIYAPAAEVLALRFFGRWSVSGGALAPGRWPDRQCSAVRRCPSGARRASKARSRSLLQSSYRRALGINKIT